eukprot:scaffold25931_cov137-Isochrysis_galbana.AAC.1
MLRNSFFVPYSNRGCDTPRLNSSVLASILTEFQPIECSPAPTTGSPQPCTGSQAPAQAPVEQPRGCEGARGRWKEGAEAREVIGGVSEIGIALENEVGGEGVNGGGGGAGCGDVVM